MLKGSMVSRNIFEEYVVREPDLEDIDEVIRMQKALQESGIKVNRDLWEINCDYISYLLDSHKFLLPFSY